MTAVSIGNGLPGAKVDCPLCNSRSFLLKADAEGYQRPHTYSIYRCPNCDTHYSWPLTVPAGLYEAIYANVSQISGYSRYAGYARLAEKSERPLGSLAAQEDVYWFIAEYMKSRVNGRNARILEVGSGLGYLTYSLNKAGYAARGMDVSAVAVANANDRYGKLYFQDDLFEYAKRAPGQYDIVIMTEVIEHVPNPLEFIAAAKALLSDGGALIMTTPNKSSAHRDLLWDTDIPPVHLWWFSEASVRQMAVRTGMTLELWDFTDFNTGATTARSPAIRQPRFEATLDGQGRPVGRRSSGGIKQAVRKALVRFGGERAALRAGSALRRLRGREHRRLQNHLRLSRSAAMGIVLKAPEAQAQADRRSGIP